MRLWEAEHAYYCEEGNFYSDDCTRAYKSFADFLDAEAAADLDLNLVFRWDWREGRDWGATEYAGDDNYRNGLLGIYFVGQRKAILRSATVEVCRADEAAVIAYLTPRLAHLFSLWEPLTDQPAAAGDAAQVEGTDPGTSPENGAA